MSLTGSSTSGSFEMATSSKAKPKAGSKTIEQRYQKKSQLEHILLRPETYVGPCELSQEKMWVWSELERKMVYRTISFVPGFYKIFDEILVNAADVKAREAEEKRGHGVQKMTSLKVDIDTEERSISVWNDGEGIPIEVHQEHNVYVPELIFGHLLTSDNYDDTEDRVTGGRNGYGAKLTNIFSSQFTVECADSSRRRKLKVTWKKNMSSKTEAKVTDYPADGNDYVKIKFTPDLSKFGMTDFDEDILSLLYKRIYDCAGTTGVKVFLNGKRLAIKDFKSYVDLYLPTQVKDEEGEDDSPPRDKTLKIYEKQDRWEVVVSMSDSGTFQQVSFVNSINTSKGGTHVAHVVDPLVQAILKKVTAKNKGGMEIKPNHVKSHIWVFVKALIVNPAFDSQTKDTLMTKPPKFGSKCELSDKTVAAVVKSPIVENILLWVQTKTQVELARKMKGRVGGKGGRSRILGIPKLEDANDAGSRKAEECTLILTEGDSAKTSCVAGLSVVGRDRYGVFPLRGKPLNVREAKFTQLTENVEIQNILRIVGLEIGKKFDSVKGLRYGSIMIMTDQDYDGSHIKGLLVNMFQNFWPELLKIPGFLKEFVTPIVKVHRSGSEIAFFTVPEYEQWKKEHNQGRGWKIRYYKGLGTSTDREFKEYFTALESHQIEFEYSGSNDFEAIDMAFNKKRTEDRKQWLLGYEEGTFVDHRMPTLTYQDFINKELVLFSKYDTERSIPSVCDGLKPGQRKVLYAVLKRNLKNELKVAQLAGYVAEHSCYHHGEVALQGTIIGMAQTFVGSNNVNILAPCGQFGSRKSGGKDASAARYILTRMTISTRNIYPEADDPLLNYQFEEGTLIEPKYYLPIIPMVLVNGAEGIGTGWSCSVPNFNPKDIIANIRRYIRGEVMEPMTPWYKGFKGTIERNDKNSGFESVGLCEKIDDETVEITELPVKKWTEDFKTAVEGMCPDPTDATNPGVILDYRNNSTHMDVNFTVTMTPEQMAKAEKEGLLKIFKLRSAIGTTNMTLFDPHGKVKKYATELDIMREFADLRMDLYKKRKAYLLDKMEREHKILDAKVRFLLMVISDQLKLSNKKKKTLIHELLNHGFEGMSTIKMGALEMPKSETTEDANENNEEEVDETVVVGQSGVVDSPAVADGKDFDYLLSMPLWNLTMERVEALRQELEAKFAEMEKLRATTEEDLWESDLSALELSLAKQDEMDAKLLNEDRKFKQARRASIGKGRGGGAARGKPKAKPKAKSASKSQRSKLENLSDDEGEASDDSISPSESDEDFDDGSVRPPSARPPSSKVGGGGGKPSSQSTVAKNQTSKTEPTSPKPSGTFTLAQRLKAKGTSGGSAGVSSASQMAVNQMLGRASGSDVKGELDPNRRSSESSNEVNSRFDSLTSWLTSKSEVSGKIAESAGAIQSSSTSTAPTKKEIAPKAKAKAGAKRKASTVLDSDDGLSAPTKRSKPSAPRNAGIDVLSDDSSNKCSPPPSRLRRAGTSPTKSRLVKKKAESEESEDDFSQSDSDQSESAEEVSSDEDSD